MAQINLLKQNSQTSSLKQASPKILVRVFLFILALLVIYYLYLFFAVNSLDKKIAQAQSQINSGQQTALTMQGRSEVLTRQQQIQKLETLISGQLYWSQLFPELARVTLKSATYTSIKAGPDQTLTLSATVPDLTALDEYMQVFNLPQFNQNFSNVRVGSFSKLQSASSTAVQFQVEMDYNPALIQYKVPQS